MRSLASTSTSSHIWTSYSATPNLWLYQQCLRHGLSSTMFHSLRRILLLIFQCLQCLRHGLFQFLVLCPRLAVLPAWVQVPLVFLSLKGKISVKLSSILTCASVRKMCSSQLRFLSLSCLQLLRSIMFPPWFRS